MNVFNIDSLDELTAEAQRNLRRRQHHNIHKNYKDPCQILLNAIEPGSYIRPHEHATDPRDEFLIAIRGLMLLVTFDNNGIATKGVRIGVNKKYQWFGYRY
jgi:cupin fold WbuC family metalloprotein